MTTTILLTGFGPFPGAPFNPTEPLVEELARRRHPAFANVRRLAHVFRVSYQTVDQELLALLKREKPDVLLMFGLAPRARRLRVETRARNIVTRNVPDAGGCVPAATIIAPAAPAERALRAPAQRLLMAARGAGVPADLSRDAGRYLCNYLCWRAAEAAGAPRLTAFIHVPAVARAHVPRSTRMPLTLDDLTRAGEAILRTVIAAAHSFR